jgi:ABC-type sulfate transport system substrate-binding protein
VILILKTKSALNDYVDFKIYNLTTRNSTNQLYYSKGYLKAKLTQAKNNRKWGDLEKENLKLMIASNPHTNGKLKV